MVIEFVGWRRHTCLIFLILLFTKPNIEGCGQLYQTKTHIIHIVHQPCSFWSTFHSQKKIYISDQDGESLPRGGLTTSSLPSPREISLKVHQNFEQSTNQVSLMIMQFGQFLSHDISLTPEQARLYI